jgi:hypothetical protein
MMHSSGGNTILAAMSLCDRLDVFGAGLFSTGPGDEKVYNHNYDEEVNRCVVDPKSKTARRPLLTHSWAFKWLKQRLADELTMHILHAFGLIRWRTAG